MDAVPSLHAEGDVVKIYKKVYNLGDCLGGWTIKNIGSDKGHELLVVHTCGNKRWMMRREWELKPNCLSCNNLVPDGPEPSPVPYASALDVSELMRKCGLSRYLVEHRGMVPPKRSSNSRWENFPPPSEEVIAYRLELGWTPELAVSIPDLSKKKEARATKSRRIDPIGTQVGCYSVLRDTKHGYSMVQCVCGVEVEMHRGYFASAPESCPHLPELGANHNYTSARHVALAMGLPLGLINTRLRKKESTLAGLVRVPDDVPMSLWKNYPPPEHMIAERVRQGWPEIVAMAVPDLYTYYSLVEA